MRERTTIDITTGSWARLLLLVLGILFLYTIRDIVLIIMVSIVIASSVEPLIRWFGRGGIPRILSALIIYLGGILAVFAIFYLLIPPLLNDFQNFFSSLPVLIDRAFLELRQSSIALPFDGVVPMLRSFAESANTVLQNAASSIFQATTSVFTRAFSLILIFVISFYLAVQEDGIANVLRIVTPKEYEGYILNLWARSQRKIGRWLQGQVLLGVIIGAMVFIPLTLLQIRYAFILSVLSAIFEIIPVFGPIMAAIPAIAIAAIQRPLLGLIVMGVYIIVQQMENHLIYPQVVRKTVGVPPLLAIIALLIGGTLAGALGIIIAVPFAVVVVEYLNDVADHKRNE